MSDQAGTTAPQPITEEPPISVGIVAVTRERPVSTTSVYGIEIQSAGAEDLLSAYAAAERFIEAHLQSLPEACKRHRQGRDEIYDELLRRTDRIAKRRSAEFVNDDYSVIGASHLAQASVNGLWRAMNAVTDELIKRGHVGLTSIVGGSNGPSV